MNINNGFGLHYNHLCIILWICVGMYGIMDTMHPPLLILSISDFSVVGKYIINSEELLIFPRVLETLWNLIYVTSLSWLMCFTPFSILLQILHSLFVLVFSLLYWDHALPTFLYDMLETLTLHFCYFIFECNDDIPVRNIFCNVHIYAYNKCLKRAWSDEPKSTLIFLP